MNRQSADFRQGVGDDFWPEGDVPAVTRGCPAGRILFRIDKVYKQDSKKGKLMYKADFVAEAPDEAKGARHQENFCLVDDDEFEAAERENRAQNVCPNFFGTKNLNDLFVKAGVPSANSLAVKAKTAEGGMFMGTVTHKDREGIDRDGNKRTFTDAKLSFPLSRVGDYAPMLFDVPQEKKVEAEVVEIVDNEPEMIEVEASSSDSLDGGNGPAQTEETSPSPAVNDDEDDPIVECQVCGQWKGKMSEAEEHISNCQGASSSSSA